MYRMENGVLTVILERTIEFKLKTKDDRTITTQLSLFAFGTALRCLSGVTGLWTCYDTVISIVDHNVRLLQ